MRELAANDEDTKPRFSSAQRKTFHVIMKAVKDNINLQIFKDVGGWLWKTFPLNAIHDAAGSSEPGECVCLAM